VIASHDKQALDVCDRIVHLRDGRISPPPNQTSGE
jgi:ABC-type lipoprotein export system ATPase subunit